MSPNSSGAGRILVADDDPDSRNILGRRLSRRAYKISEAANGQEALDLLLEHEFDLVLLDHLMPDLSGLEVLEEIRKTRNRQQLPVIMVTGKSFSEDVADALSRGANDYVTKPVDFAATLPRIEAQITAKRNAKSLPKARPRLPWHATTW